MQTLQSNLRLGRDVWDRINVPVAEFEARIARLKEALRARDLDAALLYGRGLDGCGHPTYYSNYTVKLPVAALLVVPLEAEPVLLFQGASRGLPDARATTWVDDVRACGDVVAACTSLIAEASWPTARLGLAGIRRLMPHAQSERLRAGLGATALTEIDDVVDGNRAIKSSREIDQVRRAARVVTAVMGQAASVRIGDRNERWLEAVLVRVARLEGAEDVRVMMARPGDATLKFRPAEEVALPDGGRLAVHLELARERYWAQATRTFDVRPIGLFVADSDAQKETMARLVAALGPDRTAAACAGDIAEALGPDAATALAPYGFGHGIGMTPMEGPQLHASDPTALRAGFCLALRGVWVGDARGAVVRGETVLVAPQRTECLTLDDARR